MHTMSLCKVVLISSALSSLLAVSIPAAHAKDVKLTAEELVTRHLASIGSQEARAAAHTRAISGTAQAVLRLGGRGEWAGKATILSDGRMMRIGMNFPTSTYLADQAAFDGSKVTVAQYRPGERSNFSGFLSQFDVLLKEGLLGGTSTTAWALLDVPGRGARLDYRGLKKVEGQQLHEVRYGARKGAGNLQILLYFEPETFRHVYSRYQVTQAPSMLGITNPQQSSQQKDTIYTLVEQFGDFKTVDGLTLPHSYKFLMNIEGQGGTILYEWNIAAEQVVHNQPIDAKYFVVP